MNIRFLEENDAVIYRQLRLSSLQESPFAFSDSYEDQVKNSIIDFELEIKKTGNPLESFTLGTFSNQDQLIGFVKFKRDHRSKARHRASLFSLYVQPNHRGKGIAKKLISSLLSTIGPITEIEQLQLSTIISKDSLIDFYKSFGFEILGDVIKNDLIIDNQYVDAIYMVKHLKNKN
ncbi:GNAT family N-acetyltransferase [Flavobacterium sp. UBA7682]|uniref:GNAT family N-acetyltransferase n=1 Tax=Flavobacterium sp. UBA7682 TaxID=1946560 RepID=UPI0025BCE4D3|nr:N-acetyltransferase [Flavobacterium sp. UBA7682]